MSHEYDSSQIKVLKGLEPIRKRPEFYLGDLDAPGLNTRLAFQTLCHAVDEAVEGNCNHILMRVNKYNVTSEYDVGLPLKPHPAADQLPAAMIFLALHMGCHNQKKNIEVGSELCELGLAVLNGVCSVLTASVVEKGKAAEFIFEKGVLRSKPEIVDICREDYTKISIVLDQAILKNTTFEFSKIEQEAIRISEKYKLPIQVEEMS